MQVPLYENCPLHDGTAPLQLMPYGGLTCHPCQFSFKFQQVNPQGRHRAISQRRGQAVQSQNREPYLLSSQIILRELTGELPILEVAKVYQASIWTARVQNIPCAHVLSQPAMSTTVSCHYNGRVIYFSLIKMQRAGCTEINLSLIHI